MANYDSDIDDEEMRFNNGKYTECTIYVNNLPPELNEDAIRHIFGEYGKITEMYHPRNATWTYITFNSYREVELAIRELHGKQPLGLKVALAKKRPSAKEEFQNSFVSRALVERPKAANVSTAVEISAPNNTNHQRSMGRGQPLSALCKNNDISGAIPQRDSESRYSSLSRSLSQASDVYEYEGPFESTNRLWTRGVITVTADGKRHVSLGRGYTLYEFPEQNPKIEEHIAKVYEKRHNGLYEYTENTIKNEVQRCFICSIKTTKHCEKCNTYYCSRNCQVNDWPRHQSECGRIPALVEETVNDMSSLQIIKDENQAEMISMPTSKRSTFNDVKLRSPNMSKMMVQAENSNSTDANDNMLKSNTNVTYNPIKNTKNPDAHLPVQHDDINISQIKKADQSTINAISTKNFSQQDRFRNYTNEKINQSRRSDGQFSISNSIHESYGHNNSNGAVKKISSNEKSSNYNSNVRDRNNTDRSQSYQRDKFQNYKRSVSDNDKKTVNRQGNSTFINNASMYDNLTFHEDTYLSKTKFTDVEVVIPLSNSEYWIYKVMDTDARISLMTKLQDVAKRSCNVQPIIGEVYGVMYETIWHRAMVISLNPVKVHFVDFGNDEILEKGADIRDIRDMLKVPKFAKKIRLTQPVSEKYKNLQYGDKISVRMLSMDAEKTIVVEVQEKLENLTPHTKESASLSNMNNAVEKSVSQENLKISSNANIKISEIQIPSILDTLANVLTEKTIPKSRLIGHIQIFKSIQKNVYSATLCPEMYVAAFKMLLDDLSVECAKMQESADYKPQVTDLVCGKGKDGWYRGYILTYPATSDLRIMAIDEARILPVDKILPCPKKFQDICAFGVTCVVNHPSIELQEGEIYKFTITDECSYKQESLEIEIAKDSEVLTITTKSWKFATKSSGPAFSELKSGSKICLTSYRNQNIMFARSLDAAEIEYYNNIMQRVARCARTAPYLCEPPIIKQMVIAPFCDDNSYRAMVIKMLEDDKVKIVYIDFGNIDEVSIKKLQTLPDDLALQRSCSSRILLKDVPDNIPMNIEVDTYIRNLIGEEIPLSCVYEGLPSKDGVHLTMSTGESVNDKINRLLVPGWKREDHDDKKCYMLDDLEVASLGRVGDTVTAMVLLVLEDGMRYMMGPVDVDLIHTIEMMPTMLKEYCEKTEYYVPRAMELCLALYEEAWYRAVCYNPKESYTTSKVFFIDYGNMESVEHKNIRLMPKDFITPAAMANMCTVVNLAPLDSTQNYSPAVRQKIAELVRAESIVTIKIVDCPESGDYAIELPHVRAALIEKDLVSS